MWCMKPYLWTLMNHEHPVATFCCSGLRFENGFQEYIICSKLSMYSVLQWCVCVFQHIHLFSFRLHIAARIEKIKIKAHTENEMLDTKKKKLRKWKCKMYLGCWVECVCVICVHVRVSPSLVLYEHAHAGCCKRLRKSVYDFPFIAHAVPHYCRTVAGSASAIVICVFYSLLYYYTRRVGRSSYII